MAFNPTTLDAIYNGWSTRTVVPNCSISFTSKYTSLSSAGRVLLAAPPNGTGTWTIIDGGL